MAPKTLKRPAAADAGSSKKLRTEQCGLVAAAVKEADLPKSVTEMLEKAVLKKCFEAPKEDRHAYQEQVVTMLTEVLTGVESSLKTKIEGIEKQIAESDDAKASKDAAEKAAGEAVTAKTEAAEAAKTASSEAADAVKAAKTAKSTAESEQKTGDAELEKAEKKKEKLVAAKDGAYASFKAGTMEEDKKAAGLAELTALGKEFGMDGTLLTSLPSALKKAPDTRGSFDDMVYKQVEDNLTNHITALTQTLESGAPEKAARASKVAEATAALEAAEATATSKKEALTEAAAAQKEAEESLKAAVKEVKGHGPLTKQLAKDLKDAKSALEDFEAGPKAALAELVNFTMIVPEEPAAEEAPAEAAPAEAEAAPAV